MCTVPAICRCFLASSSRAVVTISFPFARRAPRSSLKTLPVVLRRRACSLAVVLLMMHVRSCLFEAPPRARRIITSAAWVSLSYAFRAPLGSFNATLLPHGGESSFCCSWGRSASCVHRYGTWQSLLFWKNFNAAVCFAIMGDHPAFRIIVCRWSHVALFAASTRSLSMASGSVFVVVFRLIPDPFASL